MKPEMLPFLKDLADVIEKHSGGLYYTTADNGIHVSVGKGFSPQSICIGWPTEGDVTELRRIIDIHSKQAQP